MATQKLTNFDKYFFLMHTDLTTAAIESNEIVSDEVKDNVVLLEQSSGNSQMNFLVGPIIVVK